VLTVTVALLRSFGRIVRVDFAVPPYTPLPVTVKEAVPTFVLSSFSSTSTV